MIAVFTSPIMAVLLGLALVPVVRWCAPRIGAVDIPDALSVHPKPTARSGGLALWLAALLPLFGAPIWSAAQPALGHPWLLAALGATGILVLGLADDIKPLGPWTKLIAGALLALMVVRSGWAVNLTGVSLIDQALAVGWIVFFQNAFNALDGLDGLAPGVGFLGFVGLGSWFLVAGDPWSAMVAWSLAGATLAFLVYNFPPSRGIFLGDSGSQFLGFTLALLVVRAMAPGADAGDGFSVVPLFFVWVPLTEAAFVILRRLRRRVSPLRGDRLHLYDELYRRLGSMRQVALTYYAATAAVAGCAWWVLAGRQ